MTFTITDITRCSGLGHWHFTVTVDGQSRTLTLDREDFDLNPGNLQEAFLTRVRSAVKEAGATTFAQARTALINNEFKL